MKPNVLGINVILAFYNNEPLVDNIINFTFISINKKSSTYTSNEDSDSCQVGFWAELKGQSHLFIVSVDIFVIVYVSKQQKRFENIENTQL